MSDERDKDGKVEGLFKKVLTTGVTAAFMTEESIRAVLKDVPLPKDMVGGLLENAKNTKTEFVAGVKNELKTYLEKIDLGKEIDKILDKYDFTINATISLKRKKKNKGEEE